MFALVVLLAACGPAPSGPPEPTPGAPTASPSEIDIGGEWELEQGTVRGQPIAIIEGNPITLAVEGTAVQGKAACNDYGGRIRVEGNGIRVTDLVQTEMACADDRVMAAEATYLTGLGLVRSIAREGERLVLSGPEVELRFKSVAAAAEPALVGDVPGGGPLTSRVTRCHSPPDAGDPRRSAG